MKTGTPLKKATTRKYRRAERVTVILAWPVEGQQNWESRLVFAGSTQAAWPHMIKAMQEAKEKGGTVTCASETEPAPSKWLQMRPL